MPYLAVYLAGLAYVITGDSVAARDPRRFWPVLLTYPVSALPGLGYAVLKRI
jgi:hypothetical protein